MKMHRLYGHVDGHQSVVVRSSCDCIQSLGWRGKTKCLLVSRKYSGHQKPITMGDLDFDAIYFAMPFYIDLKQNFALNLQSQKSKSHCGMFLP